MQTFLVEHYRPGEDAATLARAVAAIRASALAIAREGGSLRYVRSTLVPSDEAFLSVFEAESEQLVRDAYVRARVLYDRISQAVEDAEAAPPQPHQEER
jgi:hypothetical protein